MAECGVIGRTNKESWSLEEQKCLLCFKIQQINFDLEEKKKIEISSGYIQPSHCDGNYKLKPDREFN